MGPLKRGTSPIRKPRLTGPPRDFGALVLCIQPTSSLPVLPIPISHYEISWTDGPASGPTGPARCTEGLDPGDQKTALFCISFLRKGEVLAYVGRVHNLEDLQDGIRSGRAAG